MAVCFSGAAFFSIRHNNATYPCALVSWFSTCGDEPCRDTGLWRVTPDYDGTGRRAMSIIHIDSILRGAHLMGIAGNTLYLGL